MDEVQLRRLGPSGVVERLDLSESNNFKCIAGRGSNCKIWTRSKYASRTHFTISYSEGQFILTDLNSANGTFINDVKVQDQQVLEFGNIISVGVPSDLHQVPDCIVYVFEKCPSRNSTDQGNKTVEVSNHGNVAAPESNNVQAESTLVNGTVSESSESSDSGNGTNQEDNIPLEGEASSCDVPKESNKSLEEIASEYNNEFEEESLEGPNISPQIDKLINRLEDKEESDNVNSPSTSTEKTTEEINGGSEEENDIFSSDNDEDFEAYNACTQVDEIKQEPLSLEWSRCEEVIEISDSEDENWLETLSQSQQLREAKRLENGDNVEEEEEDDDVIFLESIPRPSDYQFSVQIKKEVDDQVLEAVNVEEEDLSEVDKVWVEKLFKSQEKFKKVRLVCSQQINDSDEAALVEEVEDAIEPDKTNEKDDEIPLETFQDISKIPETISDDFNIEPEDAFEKKSERDENHLGRVESSCRATSPSPKERTPERHLSSPCSSRMADFAHSGSLSPISSSEGFSSPSVLQKKKRSRIDSLSSISSDDEILESIEAQGEDHEPTAAQKEDKEKSSSPEVKDCFVKLERIKHKDKVEAPGNKSPKRSAGSFSPRKDIPTILTQEEINKQNENLNLNIAGKRRILFDDEYDSDDDFFVTKKKPKLSDSVTKDVPSTSGVSINLEKFKKVSSVLDIRKKKRKTKVQPKSGLSPASHRRLIEERKDKLRAITEKKKAEEEQKKEDENRAKITAASKVKNTLKSRGDFLCQEELDAASKADPLKKKLKITPAKVNGFHSETSKQKYPSPERVDISKPKYPPPDKVDVSKPKYPPPDKVDDTSDEETGNQGTSFENALMIADIALKKKLSEALNSLKNAKRNQTEKSNSVTEKIPEPLPQPSGNENLPHPSNNLERRTELKSCLKPVGFNFLRSNRPLVPKRKVRFDDSKKEVKYYEKDDDKIMRKLRTTKMNVVDAGELKYGNIVFQICNWNASWLDECKSVPPEQYPPIHINYENPKKLPQKFNSHAQYMKSFIPLLLIDLWAGVSTYWKANGQYQPKFPIACTSYDNAPEDDKTESLCYFYCEGISPNDITKNDIKYGDLVTVYLITTLAESSNSLSQKSAKKQGTLVFGFVENRDIQKIGPTTKIHKALAEKTISISQENYVFKLKILLKRRHNFEIDMNTTMSLTVVQPIAPELRLFKSVCYLPRSPLCNVILTPNRPDLTLAEPLKKNKIIFKEPLDTIQQDLVSKLATSCFKATPSLHVVQGGPGTGKTHVMIALVLQLLLGDEGKNSTKPKIIYCTSSNIAADEVALKLKNYRQTMDKAERFKLVRNGLLQGMRPEVQDISSQRLALNNKNKDKLEDEKRNMEAKIAKLAADLETREKFTQLECEKKEKDLTRLLRVKDAIQQGKHPNMSIQASPEEEIRIIEGADIICTTCAQSGTRRMIQIFDKVLLDKNNQHIICIIDDAAQSREVESIIPLMLGVNKLILTGDRQQLKSVTKSKKAQSMGINRSLFERILNQFGKSKENISPIFHLKIQYRMNQSILEYPNKVFYNNQLRNGLIGTNPKIKKIKPYMVFVNQEENAVPSGEREIRETKIVEILLKIIVHNLIRPFNVAVVVSTQKQANFMKYRLKHIVTPNIEINVVEKLQGREFNAVIFLNDGSALQAGGMNLALTRAKDLLYVALLYDQATQVHSQFAKLIEDGTDRNVVRELTRQVSHEEILKMIMN